MPSVMNTYIKDDNGYMHTLNDSQYIEYQTLYNDYYWKLAEDNLPGKHTDKENFALLRQVKELAKKKADEAILKKLGIKNSSYTDVYHGISDKDIIEFKAKADIANDDGSLTQEEVISIIDDMLKEGLSNEDAITLFHSKYKSSTNIPRKWKK